MRDQVTTGGGLNYISHQNDGDNLSQQYESTITDMAYQAFNTRFPEFAPYVTTFQMIVSDIDEGSAAGAFLLDISGDMYHVPVILMDNKIKPMDMIYSKKMDKFFPFTTEWLEAVESTSLGEEGEAINQKDLGLQPPHDVTQMLQPPTAAYRGGLGLSPTGMSKMPGMNTIASDEDVKEVPKFTDLLKVASNETKEKFLNMLKGNDGVFKFAAENICIDTLKDSLQKTAAENMGDSKSQVKSDLLLVTDLETPIESLKKIFKGSAVKAMEEIAKRGFTAKDARKNLNEIYDIESPTSIEQVEKSGFYNLCKRDGSMEPALILCNLVSRRGPHVDYDYYTSGGLDIPFEDEYNKKMRRKTKLVIFSDGKFFKTNSKIAAKMIIPDGDTKTGFDKLMKATNPIKKDPVAFIKVIKDTFAATNPMYIDKVVMNSSGSISYTELDPYYYEENRHESLHSDEIGKGNQRHRSQVTILPSLPTAAKPFYSEDRNTLFLEKGYMPLVLGELADEKEYLLGPSSILHYLKNRAYMSDAKDVRVANRGGNDYSVNGKASGTLRETTEKVARDYSVPFETVYEKVATLVNRGDKSNLLVVPFDKTASIFMGTPGSQVSPDMVQDQHQEQQQQVPQQMEMPQQMPYEMPGQPQSYMDPSLMQAGAGMQNEEIYNLGAIQSIVEDPQVMEMMQEYTPALEKAMDSAGRLLLTLWTEGGQHKENLGELRFKELEGSARNAFKELGKLLLLVTKHPGEIA